ncbi:MAG: DUF1257 domain-containing protein [Anaerolineaceae bacterium]|nr:DUF1257 domain-containing protein [Anaerolineaceae bacterium]
MSHISVLKVAFADRDLLLQALSALGYEVVEGDDLQISNGERSVKVDFLVKVPYTDPIGFRKGKNGWQPAADWFRVNIDRKKFENRLKQQYAYLSVMQSLENQGFLAAEEEQDEKQRIHIVLRRTAF